MGNFHSNNRRGFGGGSRGRGFGGGGRDFERGGRGPLEMHDVICNKCGKKCQVPFRPTGDKPVFCSDCFEQNGGGGRNFGSRNSDRAPQTGASSEQLAQINAKLDKIIAVLEDLEIVVEDEEEGDELGDEDEEELDDEFEDDDDLDDELDDELEEDDEEEDEDDSKNTPESDA